MLANDGHDNWITVTVLLARRAGEIALEHGGITLTQYRLLLRLLAHGGHRAPGELSSELRLSPSTVTTAVSDLQAKGAVTRDWDAGDGRIVHVSITDVGRGLVTRIDPAICTLAHDFWSVYDEQELDMTMSDSANTVLSRRLDYMKVDELSLENAYVDSSLVTLGFLNSQMKRANMSLNEYRLLHLASRSPNGLRPKDASRTLLLRSNEVTVAASKLAKHGRVERVRLPEDRRAALIVITEAGKQKLTRVTPPIIDGLQNDICELSEDAFDHYDSIAKKILARYGQTHLLA